MWFIITVASLVVLFLIFLCIPVDMVLDADIHGKPRIRLRFSWLFGLIDKEVTGGKKPVKKAKKVTKEKKKGGKKDVKLIFEILRTKGLFGQIKDLMKGMFGSLKMRDLAADFRVGLGDPADTGFLFAFISPATIWWNSSFPYPLRIEPSFEDEPVFTGHSEGKLRLQPIQLIPPIVKFVFSLVTLRIVRLVLVRKWKRNG